MTMTNNEFTYNIATDEELQQLTPEQSLHIHNNEAYFKQLRKCLRKQTDLPLRISLTESLWQTAIIDLLEAEADSEQRSAYYKDKLKMHTQLTAMRLQALIESYPNALKNEEFRKLSHEEYRKWAKRHT